MPVETAAFECDTFFNYSLPQIGDWKGGQAVDSPRELRRRQTARFVLNTTEIDRGICLLFGIGDGRLAYDLARTSRLRVICLDTGRDRPATATEFQAAGISGSRVSVLQVPAWDQVPLPDQTANLIVLGRGASGRRVG